MYTDMWKLPFCGIFHTMVDSTAADMGLRVFLRHRNSI